ncbi:MAG TPA: hypothetical protein VK010_05510 [Flavobacteriaceae bacterium]|nr:hypothetical protein [Flavobacteriaceae bacterium]
METTLQKRKLFQVRQKMPHSKSFLCFEAENDIKLFMEITWKESDESNTLVEKIRLSLENPDSGKAKFELNSLHDCRAEEGYYRLNLLQRKNPKNLTAEYESELNYLDMYKGSRTKIIFNCITEEEIEYYEQNPCDFSEILEDEKLMVRSKDGTIINSI